MSYVIDLSDQARKDIAKHRKSGNKVILRKIEQILLELKEDPYSGTAKVERLKYDLAGKLSKRINRNIGLFIQSMKMLLQSTFKVHTLIIKLLKIKNSFSPYKSLLYIYTTGFK